MNKKIFYCTLIIVVMTLGLLAAPAKAASTYNGPPGDTPNAPDCHGTLIVGVSQDCKSFTINLSADPSTGVEIFYIKIDGVQYNAWQVNQDWGLRTSITVIGYVKWYGISTPWQKTITVQRPACPKHKVFVGKWRDDGNGVKDPGEEFLIWRINWVSISQSGVVTTTTAGSVFVVEIQEGVAYTLTESSKPNWVATTASTVTGVMGSEDVTILFGNKYVPDPPVCHMHMDPTTGVAPVMVNFDGSASTGTTQWDWTFGDGLFGQGQTTTHTYNAPGTYNVFLTATGPGGQSVCPAQVVIVDPKKYGLFLPVILVPPDSCDEVPPMEVAIGDLSPHIWNFQPSDNVVPYQLVYNPDGTLPHGWNVTANGPYNKLTVQWGGGYTKNLGWVTKSIVYAIWQGTNAPFEPVLMPDGRWRHRAPGLYLFTHAVALTPEKYCYLSYWAQWDPNDYEALARQLAETKITIFAPWGEWVTSP